MPFAPIANVVKQTQSQGIVLSGSVEVDAEQLLTGIETLRQQTGVPVLVGGSTSNRYRKVIEAAGGIAVGDDLVVGTHHLNKHIPSR